MQLEFSDGEGIADDEDPEILELYILGILDENMQDVYDAVSNCSNLHPDADGDITMDEGASDSRIVFEGNVGYDGIPGLQNGDVSLKTHYYIIIHFSARSQKNCFTRNKLTLNRLWTVVFLLHSLVAADGLRQTTCTSTSILMETGLVAPMPT